ncbi:MAG TPA: transposase domain-containing protein [Micromonosporaceae bacterium]|nr:transposase domain-containing protein [Micromonosporaceae bacterium]
MVARPAGPVLVCLPVMAQTVAVTADQVSLGVLVSTVPRDAVDAAVARYGVGARRSDGKLPAHVVAYLTMALCLFGEDDYEEVATKVTGGLTRSGCWDADWSVPTASGVTQARKRLGAPVMAEIFESVATPVGTAQTRGAWLRRWRVLAIDGFDVDLPDTPSNAVELEAGRAGLPGDLGMADRPPRPCRLGHPGGRGR